MALGQVLLVLSQHSADRRELLRRARPEVVVHDTAGHHPAQDNPEDEVVGVSLTRWLDRVPQRIGERDYANYRGHDVLEDVALRVAPEVADKRDVPEHVDEDYGDRPQRSGPTVDVGEA